MTHSLGHFQNDFIDWLCLDQPYKNLRHQLNYSRENLAALLQISPHSIRRYETENKAPHWYLLLLRLTLGDLSFYGARWANCTIQPHDRKLKAPEITQPIYPVELNTMYNRNAQAARNEADKERRRADKLQMKLDAVNKLNAELMAKIEILENENERLKANRKGIESGKVLPFKRVL